MLLFGFLPNVGAQAEPQQQASLPYLEQLPPLLDRDVFFGDPEIAGGQISPDGEYVSFLRPYQGVMNLWVKGIDEPFDAARPMTADERPVSGYFWSMDGRFLLYVQDRGGNENFHVYAVDPSADAQAESGVPEARNLTPFDGVRAYIYAVPKSTPGSILVGLNDRDPALHDVYRLDLASGKRELLIENNDNVAAWTADQQGNIRLATRQTSEGGSEILKVADGKLGETVYACSWLESCAVMRFHEDGKHAYLQSNKGENNDLIGFYLMDADNGETQLIERDPDGEVDFAGALFSNADDSLLATYYMGDRLRMYPRSEKLEQALAFLKKELPEGDLRFSPQTNDDRLVLVSISSDVDPGTSYLFDWQAMSVEQLYRSRPDFPSEHMANMRPIRYQARDGLTIPAYLTTPKGVEEKDLALIALIHGGPWARDTWGYRSLVQFLANRGYAVLQPNFRSSTGYGKAFLNAGNLEWGKAMQDDISDGIKHLVDQGMVDADKVCIMGGSYGGYATLAGMTFTPELYNCGVDIVGPSNLISLLNSIPPYWGPIRKLFTLRMGDINTEEGRAALEAVSPLFHVDKIREPLLVIQGANDPRVKQAESDQIVYAMAQKNLPVEYIVAEDEGHGFRGRINRLAMFARVEEFLSEHNGGRYQASMSEEVGARLAAITVDPASVAEPVVATELDAARSNPLPAVDASRIHAGTFTYAVTMQVGGQEMAMDSQRTIEVVEQEDSTVLRISDTAQGPMGSVADTFTLNMTGLRPISREIQQGPATIAVDYSAEKVTGEIKAGAQSVPIDVALDAPAFGDGAGLEMAVIAMPLNAGLVQSLRVVEVGMQQRVRFYNASVGEMETLELPAGSFNAQAVTLSPLDGEGGGVTFWVSNEQPRFIVKSEGKLPPQMGGGTIVSELTSQP
jgi:dipeptidyl aminopeptidase/acylaminoacyl peptidase